MATPMRKPHTNTADLLTWSETHRRNNLRPPLTVVLAPQLVATSVHELLKRRKRQTITTKVLLLPAIGRLLAQPSDGISKVVFGGQVTDEEVESLMKRKPCSGYKMKEITGSRIFAAEAEMDTLESDTPNSKTGMRMYQQAVNGVSQISFADEERVSPKKPTSVHEVAKQRELSGTLESESDVKLKKQFSDAKSKELSGHDIFGPPPEIKTRPLAARSAFKASIDLDEPAPRSVHTSVKVSNPSGGQSSILFCDDPVQKTAKKINNQKFNELSGNNIFIGDVPPSSAEKPLSVAKLREISGNDIFADGKAVARDYHAGVRKPPGGESSIALV